MTEHLNPDVQAVLDKPAVQEALDVIRRECDQAGLSWTDVLMVATGQELPDADTDQTVRPLSGLSADQPNEMTEAECLKSIAGSLSSINQIMELQAKGIKMF